MSHLLPGGVASGRTRMAITPILPDDDTASGFAPSGQGCSDEVDSRRDLAAGFVVAIPGDAVTARGENAGVQRVHPAAGDVVDAELGGSGFRGVEGDGGRTPGRVWADRQKGPGRNHPPGTHSRG